MENRQANEKPTILGQSVHGNHRYIIACITQPCKHNAIYTETDIKNDNSEIYQSKHFFRCTSLIILVKVPFLVNMSLNWYIWYK